jgi:hypothetical protein
MHGIGVVEEAVVNLYYLFRGIVQQERAPEDKTDIVRSTKTS